VATPQGHGRKQGLHLQERYTRLPSQGLPSSSIGEKPIHSSEWKGDSANFALTEFYEVHPPFKGHIVCLKRVMVKTAAAQMTKKLIQYGTAERRSNLSNGSSVRALSTASNATLASMAATHAIER
jgi:hypothetical protein